MLSTDYVKEIDRRPEPTFEMGAVLRQELGNLSLPEAEDAALDALVGVVIVDSGVIQGHPLLGPVLRR